MAQGFSERSSLLSRTTLTSSSTIPGLGSLSGKVIKRLGQVVVDGIENISIRRRLGQIEEILSAPGASHDVKECYADLLELSRPTYPSTRERACRILMAQIGSLEFKGLAVAALDLDSVFFHEHLSYILACLWYPSLESFNTSRDLYTGRNLVAHHAAGLKGYKSAFNLAERLSNLLFYSPFLLYLALVAFLGGPEYASAMVRLNVVDFLRQGGVFASSTELEEGTAPRLLLCVLAKILDQTRDTVEYQLIISALNELQHLQQTRQAKSTHDLWSWTNIINISNADLLEAAMQDATIVAKAYLLRRNNHKVDNHKVDNHKVDNLLLIGAAEGGKTTMMNQLVLQQHQPLSLHAHHYSDAIACEIADSLLKVVVKHGVREIAIHDSSILLELQLDIRYANISEIGAIVRPHIELIRSVRRLVPCYDDKTDYYLDRLDAIVDAQPSYSLTVQDIIRSHIRTTGIHEEIVKIADKIYRIYDCSGHRCERKKWVHRFDDQSLVVFVASLSEYDNVLVEDHTVNRLEESLSLFGEICGSLWFTQNPIVLLLNKKDVLQRKIKMSPICKYFPDYTGGTDVDAACEYFKGRFKAMMHRRTGVPVFFLSSVNENEVRDVFLNIHQTFVSQRHNLDLTTSVSIDFL